MTATDHATRLVQVQELLRSVDHCPEQALGVGSLTAHADGSVSGSMASGRVPVGPDGQPAAGAVGVLADDVLGFALIAASPGLSWSVSVEISLDFLAPLPVGSGLHVRSHGVNVDGIAGYARGELLDDAGRQVVAARQHGRYVAAPASSTPRPASADAPLAGDVLDLLGATAGTGDGDPGLVIEDPARWLNPLGALHGGIAICAAEAAATYATLDCPVGMRTTSLAIAFAKPMGGDGPFTFRARQLHAGRTLRVVEVVGASGGVPRTFARVIRQVGGKATS